MDTVGMPGVQPATGSMHARLYAKRSLPPRPRSLATA